MTAITVIVEPPTGMGRLYPRYDEESDILVLESRPSRAWPYGIDIDGRLILDADERRRLANVDLHIGKEHWTRDLQISWPAEVRARDIQFTAETLDKKSFHLPIRVRADTLLEQLHIEIGGRVPTHFVGLSEGCIALLSRHDLVGFMLKVTNERQPRAIYRS